MIRDKGEASKELLLKIRNFAWHCFCGTNEVPEAIQEKKVDLSYINKLESKNKWDKSMRTEKLSFKMREMEEEGFVDNLSKEDAAYLVCKYFLPRVSPAFHREIKRWKKQGVQEDRVPFENGGIQDMTKSDEAFAIVVCMFEINKELKWKEVNKLPNSGRLHGGENWNGKVYNKCLKKVIMWLQDMYTMYEDYKVGGTLADQGVKELDEKVLSNWHSGMLEALRDAAGDNERKVAAKDGTGGNDEDEREGLDSEDDEMDNVDIYGV
jgi:hypothetical protein